MPLQPLTEDLKEIDALMDLAKDLRWSWNHCADEIWKQLDPELWSLTHNPWLIMNTISSKSNPK